MCSGTIRSFVVATKVGFRWRYDGLSIPGSEVEPPSVAVTVMVNVADQRASVCLRDPVNSARCAG
jgi:hypothetical protein